MDPLLRAAHFLGGIFWIGGIVTVAVVAAHGQTLGKEAMAALRAASLKVATVGMISAWVGGLGMLLPNFTLYYATQGWMHAKLTLVLVGSALSGIVSAKLRSAAAGESTATNSLRVLAVVMTAMAIAIVLLVTLKPF